MSWFRTDPVILLGMHRSGTTMLAKMLSELGVFMGHRLEKNHEPVAVLDLNDQILARAHAAWDRPGGMTDLVEHEPSVKAVAEFMREELRTLHFRRSYLGTSRMARGLSPGPWGFKDPRTTVTWPLWHRLMPNAKFILVRRHGVDVAASLWRRARKQLDEEGERFAGDSHLSRFASVRCLELFRAFNLWVETEEVFEILCEQTPDAEMLELVYEDFLADPESGLYDVVEHLDLEVDEETIRQLAERVDPSRALAHRDDPRLEGLAEQVHRHPRLAWWETELR